MSLIHLEKTLNQISELADLTTHVYLERIPLEVKPDQTALEFLIEEKINQPDWQGDNTFHGYQEAFDITIFYGTDVEIGMSRTALEVYIQKDLLVAGYDIMASGAHYIDPETKQAIKNITVTKTQGLDDYI